jgi:hypothetical protein
MHRILTSPRRLAGAALILAVSAIALAACGSSSSGSSGGSASVSTNGTPTATAANPATTSATASDPKSNAATPTTKAATPTTPTTAPNAGRYARLRECMKKYGVPLTPPGNGRAGGVPTIPKGVSGAQFRAALEKCGGGASNYQPGGGFDATRFKTALRRYTSCLREHGFNPSKRGTPIDVKKLKTAQAACISLLRSVLPQRLGQGGQPGGSIGQSAPGVP